MTKYWIAKFVADPFRGETRNVGVFVQHNGALASRIIGIRDDGVADNRRIRGVFPQPSVFNQWQNFWDRCVKKHDLEAILKGNTANFYVTEGGSVSDTNDDPIEKVLSFLYSLLVSEGGPAEAFALNDVRDGDMNMELSQAEVSQDMSVALESSLNLAGLSDQNNLHPVLKDQPIVGRSVEHRPSFSQRNGRLYVIESIDLSLAKHKVIRERAGWMAYMFSDIREHHPEAESISIIRPERDSGADAVRFARGVLSSTSEVVDWSNEIQRVAFLRERTRIASSFE